jgi:two-component system sensor histidine kinase YesM
MLVLLILIPVVMLVFLAASFSLLRPINELTSAISGYEGLQAKTADNKLNSLSEIDHLINKVNDIRLKQKEAELNSLQNQINPHFLYNTLESIRGAALHNGLQEIASMSKALSLLFRYSISDTVLVSIKEEVQHLENYMSIQNFRYENKFDLVYSIPPELYGYKILKLTLQPLIENSIKHGLEMKLGKGVIKIDIMCLDNNIKININDNGIGIPSRKVDELNRSLAKDEYASDNDGAERTGTGIGVRNVNSRIRLYFGSQYGLKFRDVLVGTTVEITLPVVKDPE